MPNRLDFVLVVLFAIAWPLYELLFGFPRFKRALMGGGPGVRIRAYARAMATQWIFAGLALFVWARFGRPLARIGLGAPTGARFAVTLLVAALVAAFLAWQNRMIAASPGALRRVRASLGQALPLLPHTPGELRGFVALSITAGVCEEILFRGYLMAYVHPWTGAVGAIFVSSLIFGLAHGYLGLRHALQAGIAGIVMAALYTLAGSLWVPMLVHAMVDMNSGRLGYLAANAGDVDVRAA